MIRLIQILIAILILVSLVSAEFGEMNSSDDYTVQELVIFSFDDAFTPDPGNGTPVLNEIPATGNKTGQNGEMNARKLFRLREAAKADYRMADNQTADNPFALSPTASQSVSIICKQCVPTKLTEI